MAKSASGAERAALLPPGFAAFLKRRLAEGAGLAVLVAAAVLAAALATYHPADPSLNVARSGPVQNLFGPPGAYTADFLLQALGLAGGVPALVLAGWGVRLMGKKPITLVWGRILAGLAAAMFLALFLGVLPPPAGWPLHAGLGGVAGTVLLGRAMELLASVSPTVVASGAAVLLSGALTLGVGMAALLYALGITAAEWAAAGDVCIGFFRSSVASLKRLHRISMGPDTAASPHFEDPPFDVDVPPEGFERNEPESKRPAPRKRRQARPDLVAPAAAPRVPAGQRATAERQGSLLPDGGYRLPPLDLLALPPAAERGRRIGKDALEANARMLEGVLADFGVKGEIVKVRPGPVVTLYELEPAPGTKTSRVIGLADDIARSMSAVSVRVAVIPGRSVIGIELPNHDREMVFLRELAQSEPFERAAGKLTLALGKDIGGGPVMVDLARMPHLLVSGTTGSGKSVAINTMILSLLYRLTPEECRMIMIDPKMLELSVYEGIPHLLAPVVTDPGKAVVALKWTVREMEDRYRAMAQLGVRNIAGYNQRLAEARRKGEELTRTVQTGFDDAGRPVYEDQPLDMEPLPYIVVVVDEMADLMLVAGKEIEAAVQRLAQMARAAGIHLIMATQRPSVDVITGTIKANFPTRVAFQVTSKIDSRTILGEQGAEQLLGQGDMLYMAGGGRIARVHGPFVGDDEVEAVVDHLKVQGEPDYVDSVTEEDGDAPPIIGMPGSGGSAGGDGGENELYDQAVAVVAREGKASTSFIQRHLQIGYNRAARLIERMEAEGVVSKADRVGRREVLVSHHGD